MAVPEFSSKGVKFEQELKKLRDGYYKNTVNLGNSVRKFLNNLLSNSDSSPLIFTKVTQFINIFEESFQGLDNKTLFEESKYESMGNRK